MTQTAMAPTQARPADVTQLRAHAGGLLQRKCACGTHTVAGGECAGCGEKKNSVLRRAAAGSGRAAGVPPVVAQVLGSPGHPLDPGARSYMEPRFGHDFSRVRVHADARAAESARAVNALAYAVGSHVVFGAGQYAPQTQRGRRMLAHELTHVVQQSGHTPGGQLTLGGDDDHAEREAGEVMAKVTARADTPRRGGRLPISRDARPALRRWKITGDTATSDSDSDTLGGLAKKAGASFNDWKCIKPVSQRTSTFKRRPANFDSRYELYVQKGDEFDISNLTATTGTTLRIYLFSDASEAMDANIAKKFYPGSVSSLGPDEDIETTSGSGSTPISDMVIFGHASGNAMWGAASRFSPRDFPPEEPKQSFTLAAAGLFPRRCWFTRSAQARSVGCDSHTWGEDFAGHYLRKGASIVTTTRSVRPKCSSSLRNPTTGACNSYDGLDFAASPSATAAMLEGPFFTTADFHAGSFWATINGKL